MTPELLRKVGRALYGRVYKRALSEDLGINERTVRRWLKGEFNMPPDVSDKCRKLVIARIATLWNLRKEL